MCAGQIGDLKGLFVFLVFEALHVLEFDRSGVLVDVAFREDLFIHEFPTILGVSEDFLFVAYINRVNDLMVEFVRIRRENIQGVEGDFKRRGVEKNAASVAVADFRIRVLFQVFFVKNV